MSFFHPKKNVILEKAIKAEKEKLEENKALFEQKKQEFHQIKPMAAGHILGSYVDIILKQRGKLL